jgi:hypothetical protein
MPFTSPDEANAPSSGAQASLYQADIDALVAGISGNGVVYGCAVTAQGSPNNTVAVAAGAVLLNGLVVAITAANVTMPTADATNPMWVLISVNASGTLTATAGTPAAITASSAPLLPAIPANHVTLAAVLWPASDTTVASTQITDKRVMVSGAALPYGDIYIGGGVDELYQWPGAGLFETYTSDLEGYRIHYSPFQLRTTTSYDKLVFRVTTAAAATNTCRIAIYRAGERFTLGALLWNTASNVAIDSTGKKTVSVSLTLTPGNYQLAIWPSANVGVRFWKMIAPFNGVYGDLDEWRYPRLSKAYEDYPNAWPDPGEAPGAPDTGNDAHAVCVLFHVADWSP